jgi:hypothetical protein
MEGLRQLRSVTLNCLNDPPVITRHPLQLADGPGVGLTGDGITAELDRQLLRLSLRCSRSAITPSVPPMLLRCCPSVPDEQSCPPGSDPGSRRFVGSAIPLFRRVHGRYAQYYNARSGRTGHLWQNRFFACGLSANHLWRALAYVDRNPVRAGLIAKRGEYPWSNALAHLTEVDEFQLLVLPWWKASGAQKEWAKFIDCDDPDEVAVLRASTYAGRPFGEEAFHGGDWRSVWPTMETWASAQRSCTGSRNCYWR